MNSFIKYNSPSLLWALAILIMCLLPGKDIPGLGIFEFDKIVHFIIYLLLALMMYYGWKKQITLFLPYICYMCLLLANF